MKKVYQNEQHKRHARTVARRLLKRKQRRSKSLGEIHLTSAVRKAHRRREKEITAPECFSLVENPEKTLTFFSEVAKQRSQQYKVYLNLEKVKRITPDAILYMVALLDRLQETKGPQLSGGTPEDERCKHIFRESGFYKYVKSDYTPQTGKTGILEVRKDKQVIGDIAFKVVCFAGEKFQHDLPVLVRKQVYTTIMECMGNTHNHAYTGEEKFSAKWWLMALFDEINQNVHFAILDNGQGIPKTVRRTLLEKVLSPDYVLIQSALAGELRSRLKEQERGKGLPKIKEILDNGMIADLVVISNNGYVNYKENQHRNLTQKFFGSLVAWTIKEQ